MFTVKVVRYIDPEARKGDRITSLYEARSVEIIDGTKRAVVANLANGENAYIPVVDDSETGLAEMVIVENANGKTTDIVRK